MIFRGRGVLTGVTGDGGGGHGIKNDRQSLTCGNFTEYTTSENF